MIYLDNIKAGVVCLHHKGNVYTILHIANTEHSSDKFVPTVVYMGANGNIWTRPVMDFAAKFEVLHDGTKKI